MIKIKYYDIKILHRHRLGDYYVKYVTWNIYIKVFTLALMPEMAVRVCLPEPVQILLFSSAGVFSSSSLTLVVWQLNNNFLMWGNDWHGDKFIKCRLDNLTMRKLTRKYTSKKQTFEFCYNKNALHADLLVSSFADGQ